MTSRDKIAEQFYIDDHAVLYALLLKNAEEICGKKAEDVSVNATVLYARERGLRMAMRCKADGKPLTPNNYLDYGEWADNRKWSDFRAESPDKNFTLVAHKCGWNDSWRKHGLEKYGQVYCTWIDRELVRGFNPENALELDSTLSQGADLCVLRFMGAAYASQDEMKKSAEFKSSAQARNLKDFLYHTGHVFSAFRRAYLLEFGLEKGTQVLDSALQQYGEIFGKEKTEALKEEAKLDYTVVS